eukprot:Pgem_evm1s4678
MFSKTNKQQQFEDEEDAKFLLVNVDLEEGLNTNNENKTNNNNNNNNNNNSSNNNNNDADLYPKNTYFLQAILATIIFFPFGLCARWYSRKSYLYKYNKSFQNPNLSHENSEKAKWYCYASYFFGITFWITFLILVGTGVIVAPIEEYDNST